MSIDLKQMIKRRGGLKSHLTLFDKYVNTLLGEISAKDKDKIEMRVLIELENRIEKQETLFVEFNEIQNSIENLCEHIDEQICEKEAFENSHFKLISIAKNIIAEVQICEREKQKILLIVNQMQVIP